MREPTVRGETRAHKEPRGAKVPAATVIRVQNRVPHRPWKELMIDRDEAAAIAWSVKAQVSKNDLMKHGVFGLGVVTDVSNDKTWSSIAPSLA